AAGQAPRAGELREAEVVAAEQVGVAAPEAIGSAAAHDRSQHVEDCGPDADARDASVGDAEAAAAGERLLEAGAAGGGTRGPAVTVPWYAGRSPPRSSTPWLTMSSRRRSSPASRARTAIGTGAPNRGSRASTATSVSSTPRPVARSA